ncbi:MAG: FHA domain-containing protein [Aggregatilineales bacterium]
MVRTVIGTRKVTPHRDGERVPAPTPPENETGIRVVLHIGEYNPRAVTVMIIGTLIVGRGGGEGAQPDLDFSLYRAAEHGLSRQHAALHAVDSFLYIEDLNSTNGTRINGFKLPPLRRYRLRSGDELEFGSLRVTIRILPQAAQP